MDVNTQKCYKKSKNIICKKIEGESIIVPLISGIGDIDAELYSLNKTGTIIWEKIDGLTPLKDLISELSQEFDMPLNQIKQDVIDLVKEMIEKELLYEA